MEHTNRHETDLLLSLRTILPVIAIILLLSCVLMNKDIDSLVISPLENMFCMVKELTDNPMAKVR